MTEDQVANVLRANIGKNVTVTPEGGMPELLSVLYVDDEGFAYRMVEDPTLYDPAIWHWRPFCGVVDVQPMDDGN